MGQHRIFLTKAIADFAAADIPDDVLWVRHRRYPQPAQARTSILFEDFAKAPRDHMKGRRGVVVVGLNKIMTPSNRTAEVFEVLFNLTPEVPKFSVDTTLFVSAPWRAWFHFGLTGSPYREYTYSYLAESHHKAFLDGVRPDDPFGLEAITEAGRGVVRSFYRRFFSEGLFGGMSEEVVALDAETHARYQALKGRCFEEENTIGPILRRLAAFAEEACPRRSIPKPERIFEGQALAIVRTDLGIDRHLAEHLKGLVALNDGCAEAFHGR